MQEGTRECRRAQESAGGRKRVQEGAREWRRVEEGGGGWRRVEEGGCQSVYSSIFLYLFLVKSPTSSSKYVGSEALPPKVWVPERERGMWELSLANENHLSRIVSPRAPLSVSSVCFLCLFPPVFYLLISKY